MSVIKHSFKFGNQTVTLETGRIAKQATASVLVSLNNTIVLTTLVVGKNNLSGMSFSPLTVDYIEKSYAAGKIPGGFLKREGRPSDKEILTSRLIDRSIRPMITNNFNQEIQIICTVLSVEEDNDATIIAMIGAFSTLAISGIPTNGILGAVKIGYSKEKYILNPEKHQLDNSDLNMVVAATNNAVLMVESQANILNEQTMLKAIEFAHYSIKELIIEIENFAKCIKPKFNWQESKNPFIEILNELNTNEYKEKIKQIYSTLENKQDRLLKLNELKNKAFIAFSENEKYKENLTEVIFGNIFHQIEKKIVRDQILEIKKRIDGRDLTTVRNINIETRFLPAVHGSALFTRGETQAIVTATIGSGKDAKIIDSIEGNGKEKYMLHYNFPGYSVNELTRIGSPKRREIGHGNLAKMGISAVLPNDDEFPYVVRLVSEITESNGSSSMATVCGSSLALMDAGIPIKTQVAGIAMGLIKEGDDYIILTDILGDEDHLGDMDFKVAGTDEGVTALQMDIKIEGITLEIIDKALQQAKQGRMHILSIMNKQISQPTTEISPNAPRILKTKIDPSKIGSIIGKGGATIQELTSETNTEIEIGDDGLVTIFARKKNNAELALKKIKDLTKEVEPGKIYDAKVVKLVDFGAFVSVLNNHEGLVHISQIALERVENVADYLEVGQEIKVKALPKDKSGKLRFTCKEVNQN